MTLPCLPPPPRARFRLRRALAAAAAVTAASAAAAAATSLALADEAADPKAMIIARLQDICRREMNLELGLRDVGYDVWNKKTVLDGLVLTTPPPESAAVAKADRVVVVADLFAMGTGSVATVDLVRVEHGTLAIDADRPPRPDKADKREARLTALLVKDSVLTISQGRKVRVELSALEVKGKDLSAGAAGWAKGTLEGTAVARVPDHKIDGAVVSFGVKLGATVELRLDGPEGGCGAERRFTMDELTSGKLDAAALLRDAVLPCPKKKGK
ncbi:MAG TPA: hypothetical protein VG389_29640 [Myxococcota bacterium]|jgi:hypothetical protein|nr:hypothetical protein [Myxococcota bacterium]